MVSLFRNDRGEVTSNADGVTIMLGVRNRLHSDVAVSEISLSRDDALTVARNRP